MSRSEVALLQYVHLSALNGIKHMKYEIRIITSG